MCKIAVLYTLLLLLLCMSRIGGARLKDRIVGGDNGGCGMMFFVSHNIIQYLTAGAVWRERGASLSLNRSPFPTAVFEINRRFSWARYTYIIYYTLVNRLYYARAGFLYNFPLNPPAGFYFSLNVMRYSYIRAPSIYNIHIIIYDYHTPADTRTGYIFVESASAHTLCTYHNY